MVTQVSEATLWEQFAVTRSPELRERLVLQSVPLVHYLLGRLGISPNSGSEYEDLVHQGLLGLIDAVDRFDPHHGTRFATYASLRIRGKILDYLRSSDWMSRSVRHRVRSIKKAVSDLWVNYNREPTEEEIAAHLGMELDQVQKGLEDSNWVFVSLDSSGTNEDGETSALYEMLSDDRQVDPFTTIETDDLKQTLVAAIGQLSGREQLILSLYYYEELTFKDIGKVLGITESRVSQLHARALMNLKAMVDRD